MNRKLFSLVAFFTIGVGAMSLQAARMHRAIVNESGYGIRVSFTSPKKDGNEMYCLNGAGESPAWFVGPQENRSVNTFCHTMGVYVQQIMGAGIRPYKFLRLPRPARRVSVIVNVEGLVSVQDLEREDNRVEGLLSNAHDKSSDDYYRSMQYLTGVE